MSKSDKLLCFRCDLLCICNKYPIDIQFKLILTNDERCVHLPVVLAKSGLKSTRTANSQALTYQKETTFEIVFRSQKGHLYNLALCTWLAFQTLRKKFDFRCFNSFNSFAITAFITSM